MRILLVEDNEDLGEAIEKRLRSAGHSVEWVRDGNEVVPVAEGDDFDAVALDLMLPNRDGIGLIAELRRRKFSAPILVITARSEIDDKVSLLDLGADDYLVKPFDLAELSARIGSVARRYVGNPNPLVTLGTLEIDLAARRIRINGRIMVLTAREWALLEAFVQRPGQLLSKAQLEERLYSFDTEIDSNAIEVHVSRLRKKLGAHVIETERGLGYRLGQP